MTLYKIVVLIVGFSLEIFAAESQEIKDFAHELAAIYMQDISNGALLDIEKMREVNVDISTYNKLVATWHKDQENFLSRPELGLEDAGAAGVGLAGIIMMLSNKLSPTLVFVPPAVCICGSSCLVCAGVYALTRLGCMCCDEINYQRHQEMVAKEETKDYINKLIEFYDEQ
jgi:hypothetical protein